MAILSRRTIDQIRDRLDIVDVVGSYITLKKAGSAYKALCPFHKEKSPSFHVNPERQIFHCFGCGAGGDAMRFVMQHENMGFMDAVQMLAEKAGVKLEYEKGGPAGEEAGGPDKSALYDMMEGIAQFYIRVLRDSPAGKPARDYIESRKLPPDIVKQFMIGYAPDEWNSMEQWAAKHRVKRELLEAGGMIIKSDKPGAADRWYDRFRGRVMFPIRDAQGRVIGFSGRTLKTDKTEAKYVNSPETSLFRKSHVLYALYDAKKEIVERREAIICEGQIDVIRCHQAGFRNAVAGQGTAFTEDHARIVKRAADSVVLVYDSDTAGQDAAVKTATVFLQSGLAVRVASLPKGSDPDSFIRDNGAEAFAKLIGDAVSVTEFQHRVLCQRDNVKSDAGLMRVSRALVQTMAATPNAIQRSRMLQEAAQLLAVPVNALEDELRHLVRQRERNAERAAGVEPGAAGDSGPETQDGKPGPEELALAELVVASPELAEYVEKYVAPGMIADSLCSKLIDAVVSSAKDGASLTSHISGMDDPDGALSRFAARLQMVPQKVTGTERPSELAIRQTILSLWRRKLVAERAQLERDIKVGLAGKNADERWRQMTKDITIFTQKDWELGSAIIAVEMP